MKTFLTILLTFTCLTVIAAQTKYLIYLKDKGISDISSLKKSSPLFQEAKKDLSLRAIERRKKVIGEDNYITYEDLPLNEEYIKKIEDLGVKIVHKLKWFNAISCYLNETYIDTIKKLSFIDRIEKVKSFKVNYPEDYEIYYSKDHLRKVNYRLDYGLSLKQNLLSDIPQIHDLEINGRGVIIGLLDTGFRWKNNPALKNAKVLAEKDFIQNDDDTSNDSTKGDAPNQDRHGTSVFSIIAGYDEGKIIGTAYGAEYLLAKTEYVPSETHIEEDNYAAALEWMESQGVDITSSSIGYNTFDPGNYSYAFRDMNGYTTIVAKAANLAFERGVTTFTAAGNEGNQDWGAKYGDNRFGKIVSPADAFNMISVGALDTNKNVTSFSSRGPTFDGRIKPEVVALGSSVFFAITDGGYAFGNGTSYATPIAAGIGALLKSAYPHLTNYQIRHIILESGDSAFTPNNHRGFGLISAVRAISFPNLEKQGTQFILNKIFVEDSINPASVSIHLKSTGENFQSFPMYYNEKLKYKFQLPALSNGVKVYFYFTYKTNKGEFREPAIGNYEFNYGSLLIRYKVFDMDDTTVIGDPILKNYYLYQNYPNPFNNETNIEFFSTNNSHAELIIYNIMGEKIKTLFSGFAEIGKNTLKWNGSNDNGTFVTSGPYFYVLKIDGNTFVKNMLLIK